MTEIQWCPLCALVAPPHPLFPFLNYWVQHFPKGSCTEGAKDLRISVSEWTPTKCSGSGAQDLGMTGWTQEFIYSPNTNWASTLYELGLRPDRGHHQLPWQQGFFWSHCVHSLLSLFFIVFVTPLSLPSGLPASFRLSAWLMRNVWVSGRWSTLPKNLNLIWIKLAFVLWWELQCFTLGGCFYWRYLSWKAGVGMPTWQSHSEVWRVGPTMKNIIGSRESLTKIEFCLKCTLVT